jgi:ABC-2 type transport system permease protein
VRHAGAIALREFRGLFATPVAWVLLAGYLVLTGYFFFVGLGVFMQNLQQIQAMQLFDLLSRLNLNSYVIAPALGSCSFILLFVVPLITMRVFAEERAQGTLELLLTSPLSIWEIVLGKYCAALGFVSLLVVLSAFFPALLFVYGNPELLQTAAGLIGLFCYGAALSAMGLFASALTRSQIVAALVAILGALLLYMLGFAGQLAPTGVGRAVLEYLSIESHFDSLLRGLVRVEDLVYFGAFVVLFLALTRAVIESLRWR